MSTTAQKTLAFVNWTGLTLAQLIEAGRVTCPKVILEFVHAANPPTDLEDFKTNKAAAQEIAAIPAAPQAQPDPPPQQAELFPQEAAA